MTVMVSIPLTLRMGETHRQTHPSMDNRSVLTDGLLVVSLPIGMVLVVACLITIISVSIGVFQIDVVFIFFIVLCSCSIIGILLIFLLTGLKFIALQEQDEKSPMVAIAGILALGSGGVLQDGVSLFSHSTTYSECPAGLYMAFTTLRLMLTILQVTFLIRFSQWSLHGSLITVVVLRFVIILITATNACFWVYAIAEESTLEIQAIKENHEPSLHDNGHTNGHTDLPVHNATTSAFAEATTYPYPNSEGHSAVSQCHHFSSLEELVNPYVLPLFVEFCVLAGTINLAIWDACKVISSSSNSLNLGPSSITTISNSRLPHRHRKTRMMYHEVLDPLSRYRYVNNGEGLVTGWLITIVTAGFVIVAMYSSHGPADQLTSNVLHAYSLCIVGLALLVTLTTTRSMQTMVFEGAREALAEDHRDERLLSFTAIFVVAHQLLSCIGAVRQGQWILLIEGLVTILMSSVQYAFISRYARFRRLAYPAQNCLKPGRQGLEFLRWANFAIWIDYLFLSQPQSAKWHMEETFGHLEWAIISAIVKPLTILYFFHAVMFISHIISSVYTWTPPNLDRSDSSESVSKNEESSNIQI